MLSKFGRSCALGQEQHPQRRSQRRRAAAQFAHGLLKKFIFFGYDAARQSVVIGPTRLNQKGRGEAPPLLEYGGKATLVRRGKKKRVTYQARPYMGPAFEKEKPQLPAMWRGSVR